MQDPSEPRCTSDALTRGSCDQCSQEHQNRPYIGSQGSGVYSKNPEMRLLPGLVWFVFSTVTTAHSALYKNGVFNPIVNSLYGCLPTLLGSVDECCNLTVSSSVNHCLGSGKPWRMISSHKHPPVPAACPALLRPPLIMDTNPAP